MNRRSFFNRGLALSVAGLIPYTGLKALVSGSEQSALPVIKPSKLSYGDKIGLIAPGFLINDAQLEKSVNNLKQLGFQPYYTQRIRGNYGYFSNTDKLRAEDINEMFLNPEIKGIISAGGGYGCTRILNMINYAGIRQNPKVLLGFSDITALLNAIYQETGLVTFHGPVGQTIHREYNALQFNNIIMNPRDQFIIESTKNDLEKAANTSEYERYTINEGIASGKLAGGNLTLICAMTGTPYQVDFKDKIVCFEDVDEKPYRIDRMLTQLIETGELQKASGIAFGILRGCNKSDTPESFSLREIIEDRIKPLKIPAVYGLSFGHNINNFTIPVGINAVLDAGKMIIKLTERAVI